MAIIICIRLMPAMAMHIRRISATATKLQSVLTLATFGLLFGLQYFWQIIYGGVFPGNLIAHETEVGAHVTLDRSQ